MKNITTTHRHYPQPHLSNRLQDDVGRLATAFEMVDQDVTALQHDKLNNQWQTLDLTGAATQADTFYPVLVPLSPALGSQVLEVRVGASLPESDAAASVSAATNWQASFACLGDVWEGDSNLTLIRHAQTEQHQDLLADYQWDVAAASAVLWLRGQQAYQIRSSHQVLAVLPVATATELSTLETVVPHQVQAYPHGLVLATAENSTTYASLSQIDADKVTSGQFDLLTYIKLQVEQSTHAQQIENLQQAQAQLEQENQQRDQKWATHLAQQNNILHTLLNEFAPVGEIKSNRITQFPEHFVLCDGRRYATEDYPALADCIGEHTWQTDAEGLTSFTVPFKVDTTQISQASHQILQQGGGTPRGVAVDEAGGRVFMMNASTNEVWVYDMAGTKLETITGLSSPYGACYADDRLFVANHGTGHIYVYDGFTFEREETISLSGAIDVKVRGDEIWVARYNQNKVTVYNRVTKATRDIATQSSYARALAVIDDILYVCHNSGTYVHQISMYHTATGQHLLNWNPGLSNPYGLAIQGTLLCIADHSNHRIRLYNRLTRSHLGDISGQGYNYPYSCRIHNGQLWVVWNNQYLTRHDLDPIFSSMRAQPLLPRDDANSDTASDW